MLLCNFICILTTDTISLNVVILHNFYFDYKYSSGVKMTSKVRITPMETTIYYFVLSSNDGLGGSLFHILRYSSFYLYFPLSCLFRCVCIFSFSFQFLFFLCLFKLFSFIFTLYVFSVFLFNFSYVWLWGKLIFLSSFYLSFLCLS